MTGQAQQPIAILLIEDNEADAFLINETLSYDTKDSYVISHVCTVEEAEKKYNNTEFHVLLLDLNLPGISGIEAVEKVRKEQPFTAIIVLTGLDDEDNAVHIMQKGVQDYLVKGRYGNEVLPRSIRFSIERKNYENHLLAQKVANG